jgi:RHS repeat-associated protein
LRKGGTEHFWDQDGRLVERRRRGTGGAKDEVWRYTWDAAGLLKEVERPDGVRVEMVYDPFARRVLKRVTGAGETRFDRVMVSETRFVWDGDVLVHEIREEAQSNGDPVVLERTYCFKEGFEPFVHRERRHDVGQAHGAWFHYLNDPIGTPERLVAEDGSVACEIERSAWGPARIVAEGRATTPIRLQGQYADEETGLIYNRWRYLFAGGDVYCSSDPLGLMAGTHLYRGVSNPFRWMDPFGLASQREAEHLVTASEGRPFPGGSNVGHAGWHVPPAGADADTLANHAASRGNAKNTTFRSRNQATRALRNCLNTDQAQIAALTPGQTYGTTHDLPLTVPGVEATKGPLGTAVSPVNVNSVSYRVGRLPNGDLHLLHFQPHGS